MKKFSDLTEREVLAVAIASEEDGRIYMSFAENLAKRYPESARIFEQMAEEEKGHRHRPAAPATLLMLQREISALGTVACAFEPQNSRTTGFRIHNCLHACRSELSFRLDQSEKGQSRTFATRRKFVEFAYRDLLYVCIARALVGADLRELLNVV